jgi:hypothetical protein
MWFRDGQSILIGARNAQNNTCFYKVDARSGETKELVNMGSEAPPQMALSPEAQQCSPPPLDKKPGIVAAFNLTTGKRTDATPDPTPSSVLQGVPMAAA